MAKITIIILILIGAASIYLGMKLGKPYYAYFALKRSMQHWTETCLTRTSYDRAALIRNVMDTIRRHNIPLKEGHLKIKYNREERHLSISAQYEVEVKFPGGYTHIFHFRPSAEDSTTPI